MLADLTHTHTEKLARLRQLPPRGGRGLLRNWPANVVAMIDGEPLTTEDILCAKRERQATRLYHIRHSDAAQSVPCFVWTFDNGSGHVGGLYIYAFRYMWGLTIKRDTSLVLEIMSLFPCGYLSFPSLFCDWRKAFGIAHPRLAAQCPRNQGWAAAHAIVEQGKLLAVTP